MLKILLLCTLLQAGQPMVSWRSEFSEGKIVLTGQTAEGVDHVSGTVTTVACEGNSCHSPEDWEFDLTPSAQTVSAAADADLQTPAVSAAQAQSGSPAPPSSIWKLILEAILWGLAMLLTPCVFPMVPMTVSFFLKGEASRFRALMYGVFIVLLYTVPICIIIGATWLFGGSTVTADIFNWLSTHWIPNILFFLIFMVFAASFFGAFEITLPSSWVNKSDSNSDRKGLPGIFFLALTLVLVSFSCTGPIVGTVLIKSTQGEFWTPMVTMLAFSLAFALPFTLFAFFPSMLSKLPKSGGWLNSVKVVLGFVELALGLKFLSTADQVYHWHILDREVYLAIWIVCFALLGFYLLGKLRFRNDDKLEYISVGRLALAIADLAFVVYLIPGMWGAPLKALSGYLPPLETQDFVLGSAPLSLSGGQEAALPAIPYYDDIEEALEASRASGKPVFVDITGHGCVNCREMEARVWTDPQVDARLRNDFEMVKLYVDDKTPLPEDRWIIADNGRTLKDLGRVNSYIALKRFGVNAQPNYIILAPEGDTCRVLAGPRGYDLSIPSLLDFLSSF